MTETTIRSDGHTIDFRKDLFREYVRTNRFAAFEGFADEGRSRTDALHPQDGKVRKLCFAEVARLKISAMPPASSASAYKVPGTLRALPILPCGSRASVDQLIFSNFCNVRK